MQPNPESVNNFSIKGGQRQQPQGCGCAKELQALSTEESCRKARTKAVDQSWDTLRFSKGEKKRTWRKGRGNGEELNCKAGPLRARLGDQVLTETT